MKYIFLSLLIGCVFGCRHRPQLVNADLHTGVTYTGLYKVYIANGSAYEDSAGTWHVIDAVAAIKTLIMVDSENRSDDYKYIDSLSKVIDSLKRSKTVHIDHLDKLIQQ